MAKIIVISGFLGAGKTTLILKLVREMFQGQKVCVIENEFGSINFDGQKLERNGLNIRELQAGCICCTLITDLKTTIESIEADIKPDYIIIEPSGTSDLPAVKRAINIAALPDADICSITVVDAMVCSDFIEDFGDFYRNQIVYADGVVLSHMDECDEEELSTVVKAIEKLKFKGPIICTQWSRISAEEILATIEYHHTLDFLGEMQQVKAMPKVYYSAKRKMSGAELNDVKQAEMFMMVTIEDAGTYTKEQFEKILMELTKSGEHGEILRVKGIVSITDKGLVQFDWIKERQYAENVESGILGICVIGRNLKKDSIRKLFQIKNIKLNLY